jgi:murein DD-endopeptidase MepM/ murein hydrolase activator NlpD
MLPCPPRPITAKQWALVITAVFFMAGFVLPEQPIIPVRGATARDWNHNTFWFEPWGKSGVHKGIDIFSPMGTPVIASTYGMVVYTGILNLGGNVVVILSPGWRLHYYAHLQHIDTGIGALVGTSQPIGTVGNSGNARDKPSHLHYTILSIVPYLWRWDNSTQGWKKMFFLNPSEQFIASL